MAKKNKGSVNAKQYNFSLQVMEGAMLELNASETITAAMLEATTMKALQLYPSIVGRQKIGLAGIAGTVLKSQTCNWDSSNVTLDGKEVEACSFSVMVEVCQWDVEQSYFAQNMRDGKPMKEPVPAELQGVIQTLISEKLAEELELISWQGDTDLDAETDPLLSLCDGFEKQLKEAYDDGMIPLSQIVVSTNVTEDNVINKLKEAYKKIPKALRKRRSELRWFVSSNILDAYLFATAEKSNEIYFVGDRVPNFLGIELTEAPGSSDNVILIARKKALAMLTDMVSGAPSFNSVNMMQTTAEPKWRIRADLKFGVSNLMDAEVVIMLPSILPAPAPTITSVAPTSGEVGDQVTITGTNFVGATGVVFGSTAATNFTIVSATEIQVEVPTVATGSQPIKVETPSGTSDAEAFTVV